MLKGKNKTQNDILPFDTMVTFRLEYEDDYEYEYKVLSTRTSKIFALQT